MIAHAKHMQSTAMESAEYSMAGPFTVSLAFHAVFFILTFVSLPFITKDPVMITPISVELVDIEEFTQTNKRPPPKAQEKPKPIDQPKEPEPPKPPPEPEPEQVKEPDPVLPPKPKEPEKVVEKPKPTPPKPKPKEKPKAKPKEEKDDFSSLLKDLTPREETDTAKPRPETVDPEGGQAADFANRMSMSELDALRAQIEPCWNFPSGAKYAEQLIVTLRLQMGRDAKPVSIDVVEDGGRYNRDPAFTAAADAAKRAVRNPRCLPFRLPPEKYNDWKTITINFDPSAML